MVSPLLLQKSSKGGGGGYLIVRIMTMEAERQQR